MRADAADRHPPPVPDRGRRHAGQAEQDRFPWDQAAIAEGVELITATLATSPVGPYQVQAAIAAVHDEAPDAASTGWRQILVLYDLLRRLPPGPMRAP